MNVSRNGIITDIEPQRFETTEYGPGCVNAVNETGTIMANVTASFEQEKAAVMRDNRYTQQGKAEQIAALRQKYAPRLQAAIDRIEGLGKQTDQIKAQIVEPVPQIEDKTLDALRLREIRDRLLALPEAERQRVYLTASNEGDTELVRAVETSPRAFPVVGNELVDRARKDRLAKLHKGKISQVNDLESAAVIIKANLGNARRLMGIK